VREREKRALRFPFIHTTILYYWGEKSKGRKNIHITTIECNLKTNLFKISIQNN
jgi:hypothetical protein